MRARTRIALSTGGTALAAVLAACGASQDHPGAMPGMDHSGAAPSAGASTPVQAGHDAADVSFAQDMIVHHQGAVDMAGLAATRASDPEVKELATRIGAAQGPEIAEMARWLRAWGEPASASDSMAGMDHSSEPSPGSTSSTSMGMTTQDQMRQLEAATGTDFDRMFLRMMTTHHQGAIEMAEAEQADGSDPRAVALAGSIAASQSTEVAQMGQMLQRLGA